MSSELYNSNLKEMSHFRLFGGLSDTCKKQLAQHSVVKVLKKSEFVWHKNEPGECCILILSGLVEVSNTTKDGDERIIGIFGPGEMIGLSAILKQSAYPADAVVSSKHARVMKLFIRGIDQSLPESERRSIHIWLREMLLIHEQILRDKIMILGAGRLHTKLIELFEHLRLRFANQEPENTFFIPVPVTKTQIAKMIEARVETVIRTLNKWEKAKYIVLNETGIQINGLNKVKSLEEVS